MAPTSKHFHNLRFQALLSIKNQQQQTYQPQQHTSDSALPMLALAVLSIATTAFLLLSFFIFLTKCCSIRNQVDLLRWVSILRARQGEDPIISFSPTLWNRGLDDSLIREIPTFQFKRGGFENTFCECVVCLNEFQEQDMLRVLPNCSHAFHLDCIDIWLQSNANCPLCRTSISGTTKCPIDRLIAPSSSPQDSHSLTDSTMGGDENFVIIELGGENEEILLRQSQSERENSREVSVQNRSGLPKKLEQKLVNLNSRKCHHVSIMGDECISVGKKDDQFSVQPIRRSFSLDSATDQQLHLTIQAIVQETKHHLEINASEECSNRVRKSFFPFRHGRGSRNAILPVEF